MVIDDAQFDALLAGVLRGERDFEKRWGRSAHRFSSVQIQTTLGRVETALSVNPKDVAALTLSAYMHQKGLGGAVNYPEAIRLYDEAIALGSSDAMNDRAYMHKEGLGGAINYPEAIRLCEEATALGSSTAMCNRAYMHQKGLGGEKNLELASELYYQSCRDIKESRDRLQELAWADCVKAQFYLVLIAILGEGGASGLTEAKTWFIRNRKVITELLFDEVLRLFDENLVEKEKIQAIIDFLIKNGPYMESSYLYMDRLYLSAQSNVLLNNLLTIAIYRQNKAKIIKALEQGADICFRRYIHYLCYCSRVNLVKHDSNEKVYDLLETIIDYAKNASGNSYQDSDNQVNYDLALEYVIFTTARMGFPDQTVELIRKLVAADAGLISRSTEEGRSILHYLLSMQDAILTDGENYPDSELVKQQNQYILAILKIIAKSAHISQLLQPTVGRPPIELAMDLGLVESAKILMNPEHDETELTQRNIFRVRHIILQDKDPIKTLRERWPNLDMPLWQEGYPEYNAFYLALNNRTEGFFEIFKGFSGSVSLELIFFLAQATEAKQALQQKFPNGQTLLQWVEEKRPQFTKIIQDPSPELLQQCYDVINSRELHWIVNRVLCFTSKGKKRDFLQEKQIAIGKIESFAEQKALVAYFFCVAMTPRHLVEAHLQVTAPPNTTENTADSLSRVSGLFAKAKEVAVHIIPGEEKDNHVFPPTPKNKMAETSGGKELLSLLQENPANQKLVLDLSLEDAGMASSSVTNSYAKVYSNLWQQQQQHCVTKKIALGYHSLMSGDAIEDNKEIIGTDEDPTASFL